MKPKHWLVFLLLGAIWSSSFMWIKIAIQEVGPVTLVAFRVSFGLLFGIAVILIQRVQLPRTLKAWTPILILGLTNVAIPFFLISWGEQYIDSAVASILDATVPLFTIVFANIFLKDDKMTLPKVAGLVFGFIGVVILMSKDIHTSANSILGQAAVVLASVFYAGSVIIVRRTTEDMPGIIRGALPLASASAVMWIGTFLVERPLRVPQLGISWVALLFLGVVGSGIAFMMSSYLVHEIGPTRLSMVTYLFPLGGVALGVTFLSEQLSWQLIAGAVLIIVSLVVANLEPTKSAPRNQVRLTTEKKRIA